MPWAIAKALQAVHNVMWPPDMLTLGMMKVRFSSTAMFQPYHICRAPLWHHQMLRNTQNTSAGHGVCCSWAGRALNMPTRIYSQIDSQRQAAPAPAGS
jgi:hypothetical protein